MDSPSLAQTTTDGSGKSAPCSQDAQIVARYLACGAPGFVGGWSLTLLGIERPEASLRLHQGLDTPDETLLLLGWVSNSRESRRGLVEVLVRVPPKGILEQCLFESALSRLLSRRLLRQLSTSDASTIAGWIDVAAKRGYDTRVKICTARC